MSQIEDIEDLCTICLPHVHPNSTGVVRYPMKVEKKKAREETDLVLALEWRSVKEDSSEVERWFLLEKRPDEGTKFVGGAEKRLIDKLSRSPRWIMEFPKRTMHRRRVER